VTRPLGPARQQEEREVDRTDGAVLGATVRFVDLAQALSKRDFGRILLACDVNAEVILACQNHLAAAGRWASTRTVFDGSGGIAARVVTVVGPLVNLCNRLLRQRGVHSLRYRIMILTNRYRDDNE
jgi:hypothetical protein